MSLKEWSAIELTCKACGVKGDPISPFRGDKHHLRCASCKHEWEARTYAEFAKLRQPA